MITLTPDEIDFNELCNFSPRQKEAQQAVKKYKYLMYGGAMGGGKSYWLRWELVDLLTDFAEKGFKGVRVGLFCEDYPALKDRQISKIKYEFPAWLGTYNQADHEFTLAEEYGAGVICFRNLDDSSKYQSAEFAVIAIDELTKNPKENFIFLKTRLRWPGIKDVKFISGTNPGGIGHAWVKKIWLDKVFEPEEEIERELYYFIPARAEDNPHLDNDYYTQLDSLPPEMAKAYREGDWDIFKGQYFKEWRRDIHTCEPFAIPEEWTKFICLDYGFAKPSAVYWCAINPKEQIYLYRELYQTDMIYSDLTKKIIALTPQNETIKYWVADPACWKTKGEERLSGGEIIQQIYKEIVKKTLMLLEGNNARISGWSLMREYLKPFTEFDGKITAKLQVFTTCHEFIRTFPSLVYDKVKVEDCDTDGEDHCLAGDTLIDTDKGQQNIKSLVGTTGYVKTLEGLKKYDRVAQTKWNTKLLKLDLENNKSIIVTPEHKVLTQRGWIEIQALDIRFDSVIQLGICITLFQKLFRSLEEKDIIYADDIFSEKAKGFTLRFGNFIMEKFQRVIAFITKILIGQTMILKTLSLNQDMSICHYTLQRQRRNSVQEKILKSMRGQRQSNGINPQRVENGIKSMVKKLGQKENIIQKFVSSVVKNIKHYVPTIQNTAIKIVKLRHYGKGDAYNLRVPDVLHFSINGGLIVHNSADAVRYGIMTKPKAASSALEVRQKFFDRKMAEKARKHGKGYNVKQTGY